MTYQTLQDRLRGPIADKLKKDLSISNTHALPRIDKVVLNVGINKSKIDSKEMQAYIGESLGLITGQKPVFTIARKAISNFKIREGMVVGAMVTLRGKKMEEFLDRLISYALPRIRDFRGVTVKLDGHGNYALGLRDHSVFPEVPPPDAKQIFGLQIQISTTTDSDDEARALLKEIGMPFTPQKSTEQVAAEAAKAEEQQQAKEAVDAINEEAKDSEDNTKDADDSEDSKEKAGANSAQQDTKDPSSASSDSSDSPQSS